MWVITARSAKKQKCIGSVSLLSRESSSSLFSPRFPAEGIAAQVQKWSHARRDSLPTATVARNEKTLGASPPFLPRSAAGNSGWSQGETPLDSGRGLGGVRVMLCMKRWTHSPRRHFCDFFAWTIPVEKGEKSNRLTILRQSRNDGEFFCSRNRTSSDAEKSLTVAMHKEREKEAFYTPKSFISSNALSNLLLHIFQISLD